MKSELSSEVEIQRKYYAKTASRYNERHVHEKDEHYFSLLLMVGALDFYEIKSILEIGAGTGRIIMFIKEKYPGIHIVGVEPVAELRDIGHRAGISKEELIEGDALNLQFDNVKFDLVCEFGVLHHIKSPELAISEMLRVASKAIFISDSNNFGQGSLIMRNIKQLLNLFGLWKLVNLIKTKGKGYSITEGDGLSYSYSVFNNYKQIKSRCKSIHLLNVVGDGVNIYRNAGHVALLGIKKLAQ